MKIYHIEDSYISYLKQYESKVPENKGQKRPYLGVVLEIDDIKYYAPLTSPKPKHKKMKNGKDFRKIRNGLYGAINFNNMIPVLDSVLELVDIENEADPDYKRLLQKQADAIKDDQENIEKTAKELRSLIAKEEKQLTGAERKIKDRCCDLIVLEQIYRNYKP